MNKDALAVVPHPDEGEIVQTGTAAQVTMIHELTPTSHGKILEARVYRKWTAITYGKKTETGISGKKKGDCLLLYLDR